MLRFFSQFKADFQLKSGWIEPLLVGGYAPFSPAMSEKELEIFRNKVRAGLLEAERNMLHEKAARGETCVYQDDNGRIYHVAAKDVIAANPRFQ